MGRRHPAKPDDIDQRAQQNIGSPPSPRGQFATRLVAEHAKEGISKKGDEGAWYQHIGQRRALISIPYELEDLAGKHDNTKCRPVKVEPKPENADRDNLCPA